MRINTVSVLLIPCLVFRVSSQVNITTDKGTETTLDCSMELGFDSLAWQGPPNSVKYYGYPNEGFLTGNLGGKVSRLNIASNYSLLISNTQIADAGAYKCVKGVPTNTSYQVNIRETNLSVNSQTTPPVLTASVPINGSKVLASEDQSVTIYCKSRNGYPAPTVILQKGDIPLGSKTELQEADLTYTVTLAYTFKPTNSEDGQQLVCLSYWPSTENVQVMQQADVSLFLYLKPNQILLTSLDPVVTGSDVTVECRTSGSRPAANISWKIGEKTLVGVNTVTSNSSTQTFSTVSVLRRRVTSADNGHNLTCKVSHLTGEQSISRILNIQFAVPSSSTRISGNTTIVANGDNPLYLTCITGSSNPAPVISWKKGSSIMNNDRPATEQPGENNGVISSQVLILRPTRDDNGKMVTCSVSNTVSSVADTATVTLALHYGPNVTIKQTPVTINEQTTVLPVILPCYVDSNPLSNVTWSHNGQEMNHSAGVTSFPYSISSPSRTSYGSYKCMADNGLGSTDSKTYMVEVLFRPLNITIEKPGNVVADGTKNMSISCVTGSSNPAAEVTWSSDNIQTTMHAINNKTGQYGGKVVTSTITFTPTREHDGLTVSCTARNNMSANQPVSDSTTIDNIKYSPLISSLSNKTVVEGKNIYLNCSASSKPASKFRWENSSGTVAEGDGTASYNGLGYTITAVSRHQAGIYTCTADNQIPPNDSRQIRIVVQYPPDVVVTAFNTTVHSQSTTLTCGASGVPDEYTFERWVHTFNGVKVSHPEPLPASRDLTIKGLSYAYSGVYKCGASNGIKDVATYDEATLLVRSFPILIGERANFKEIKASGQLTKPTVINFQYYSNTGRGSIKVLKSNRTEEGVGEILQRNVDVTLPVFLSKITIPGTEVTINITMMEEGQFGEYQIIVTNEIGSVNLSLIIQPFGPPETPTLVNSTVIDHHSVIISWISGFPNGLNQTFVIQTSTDNTTWRNISQYGGMSFQKTHTQKVDRLDGSQVYFVRILARNGEGESQPTGIFNFQTAASPNSTSSPIGLIAGGAAGGSVAALLVIAVIIFIVWRRRDRSPPGKAKDTGALVVSSNRNPEYDDGDEEVENPAYVSAGPRETNRAVGISSNKQGVFLDSGNVYAKVSKKPEGKSTTEIRRHTNEQPDKDLYAVPDKSKGKQSEKDKQKPSKADKDGKKKKQNITKTSHQTGDMYENAPRTMFGNKPTTQQGESVYEDTSITTSVAPKKPTGADGLLYADLAFSPRKKGPTKIIGIEDRCEYTTIDLTKKAKPLPDSDDEDKTKQ